jgi:hypothetical protein
MNNRLRFASLAGICAACWIVLAGCGGQPIGGVESTPTAMPTATDTPTATPFVFPTPEPSPTAVPRFWISPTLPSAIRGSFLPPSGWRIADNPEEADLRLGIGGGESVATWVYALVAPFPTVEDGVSSADLLSIWSGTPVGPFGWLALLMDQETLDVLSAKFGPPAENAVRLVETERLADEAWDGRPAWAIVPFEQLEPRWKVLTVDGISPLRKEFRAEDYLLSVDIALDGDPALTDEFKAAVDIPAANRDPLKLTVVVMTGVTALVRGTAWLMEEKGILYPAQDIASILQSADLTHISNEIAFVPDCPFPNPGLVSLNFCSDPRYIDLLEYIGTDIVELTGNHLKDWSPEALSYTIGLYKQRGWLYFGGGANLNESRKAALVEHHGNRLAFIGCDAFFNDKSWATETEPGSAPCDMEFFRGEVRRLRESNYLPIMTFQYYESNHYTPTPDQELDFRSMADDGAVIVSGSQAHFPQSFAFPNGSFVHYGLGNLFFDQYYVMPETRNAFIDRHIFYAGRYLGTELITIVFEDNARARLMTPEERSAFLRTVFSNSIW